MATGPHGASLRSGCARLNRALATLDPQSRRTMEMFLEGMSGRRIADELGLNETQTAALLLNLVLALRDQLDG